MDLLIALLIVVTVVAAGMLAAFASHPAEAAQAMPGCTGLSWEIGGDDDELVEWLTDCCPGWEAVTDADGRIIGYTNG